MVAQIFRMSMLIMLCLLVVIGGVSANDITVKNFRQECRIGPIGVTDRFDMSTLNRLFGPISGEVVQHNFGIRNAGRYMGIPFQGAYITVVDDGLATISVSEAVAQDGTALGTPRGIVVGHSLDTVFRLYGTPSITRKSQGSIVYVYGNSEVGLSFWVNPVTNKVVRIGAYIPDC